MGHKGKKKKIGTVVPGLWDLGSGKRMGGWGLTFLMPHSGKCR